MLRKTGTEYLETQIVTFSIEDVQMSLNFYSLLLPIRIKPAQKTPGIANGTSPVAGQQQVKALCDISAQVQQYQQFLGE